jgi:sodium-dependent dicarboxylate transporter 2/3/5
MDSAAPRLAWLLGDEPSPRRLGLAAGVGLAAAAACLIWLEPPVAARAAAVALFSLALWLGEAVRPWVPTLLLLGLIPPLLGPLDAGLGWGAVGGWLAEPVLALFLGGFAMGAAAARFGLDRLVAQAALRGSGGGAGRLLWLAGSATAALSMWMSNVAAAAMMFAALRPILARWPEDAPVRRGLLLAVAMGANFGGLATPIGTGPNGLAIAALEERLPITFLHWMLFALPLTAVMCAGAFALLAWRFGVRGRLDGRPVAAPVSAPAPGARGWALTALFGVTAALWLTEPLHGRPAWQVALASTAALGLGGFLRPADWRRMDWSTLLLVAGGVVLGRLLERAGVVPLLAGAALPESLPAGLRVAALCGAAALLAGLMSNTATAALLIPLAALVDPSPAAPVLIALAASMGVPFVISTPANAMAFGEGGLRAKDLLGPGLALMLGGVALVAFAGPRMLDWLGVP